MISKVLSNYSYGTLSGFGMLLFLAVFLGTTFWTFRKNGRQIYQYMASLPLDEKIEEEKKHE